MTTGVRAGFLLDPAAEAIYDEDAHAAADRRTEFRLEAEAEARGGLAPEDPADEATRAGAVNWTGALNEFLQHRYGLDVGSPVFREAYDATYDRTKPTGGGVSLRAPGAGPAAERGPDEAQRALVRSCACAPRRRARRGEPAL